LAEKVLVSMTLAPARRYSSCMPATISGWERFARA
jgi:hypothetical protein